MAIINGNQNNNQLTGTALADEIRGKGGNDKIKGLAGSDLIFGNGGNDTIEGGEGADEMHGGGTDTLSYANSDALVVVTLGIGGLIDIALLGHAQGDTGDGFENITGSAFNDALTGNDLANVLKGGDRSDILQGNGGNDTLIGGAVTDQLDGGGGNDRLKGGAGDGVVITSGIHSVTLLNVDKNDLHQDDFGFVS